MPCSVTSANVALLGRRVSDVPSKGVFGPQSSETPCRVIGLPKEEDPECAHNEAQRQQDRHENRAQGISVCTHVENDRGRDNRQGDWAHRTPHPYSGDDQLARKHTMHQPDEHDQRAQCAEDASGRSEESGDRLFQYSLTERIFDRCTHFVYWSPDAGTIGR